MFSRARNGSRVEQSDEREIPSKGSSRCDFLKGQNPCFEKDGQGEFRAGLFVRINKSKHSITKGE
jgi:hypothetical protein